jgi:hypothetical protein
MSSGPPPLTCAVVRRDAKGPGSETLHVDLTLTNRRDAPRWFVLRAYLHEALEPRLRASLLQLCGLEAEGVRYLQALAEGGGGFVAFRLAGGASLEVRGFVFRSMGAAGLEVWEVGAIHVDDGSGERAAEDCFDADLELAGAVSAGGGRRSTRATRKGLDVRLDVLERWEGLPLDG